MIQVEDKSLALPDGRTLAYADNGNTSSLSIVLFLHGAFSVGDASRLPRVLIQHHVHFVAPSLPGWGKSSPVGTPTSYATSLAADITALITHLHPQTSKIKLYICGHSFGSISAQMLYGLPHDVFPLGRQMAALVLLAPLSPPHCHKEYSKHMTWSSYILSGPPASYTPFNIAMHLVKIFLANYISSEASAESFVHQYTKFDMSEEEREMFFRWLEDHGLEEAQYEKEIGKNMVRSVAHTWRGFLDIPAIYHSGWGGFRPETIPNACPVLVVSSESDYLAPEAMARWLVKTYHTATLRRIPGSHNSSLFNLDDVWSEILRGDSTSPTSPAIAG